MRNNIPYMPETDTVSDYKEYHISNTSSLFMALLRNKKIPHLLTEDGKMVKVYLYCDLDLLQLGQTFQRVLDTNVISKIKNLLNENF